MRVYPDVIIDEQIFKNMNFPREYSINKTRMLITQRIGHDGV